MTLLNGNKIDPIKFESHFKGKLEHIQSLN